jgi:dynein heavy chain 2, cytosolic
VANACEASEISLNSSCELYREWSDGVLTSCARKVAAAPLEQRSWIVCDGDIDPEWIEALNSVLDDNRLLTMPHGERIQFAQNVNFIFECHSLTHASPATVSRCGVIYLSLDDASGDVRRAVTRFCAHADADARAAGGAVATGCFDPGQLQDLLRKALAWLQERPDALAVATSAAGVVANALSQLEAAGATPGAPVDTLGVPEHVGHGVAACLKPDAVDAFLQAFAGWAGTAVAAVVPSLLDSQAALSTAFIGSSGSLACPPPALGADPSPSGLVMTETLRTALATATPWLLSCQHFLICGNGGCGKRTLLAAALAAMPGAAVAHVACNAHTKASHLVQKLLQARFSLPCC